MKKMKKFFSVLLAVLLVLAVVPQGAIPARAATTDGEWVTVSGIEGGRIRFDKSNGTITDCENTVTKATIPNSINGVDVKRIGGWAFANCNKLSNVTVGDSITSIGEVAFYQCRSLSSVMLSNEVTTIGEEAFRECSVLSSIVLPNGLERIERGTFSGCSALTSVIIPDNVTIIGREAFIGCDSLVSIDLPNSITEIGEHAFYACSALTPILIPSSVTSIGENAFYNCPSFSFEVDPENPVYSALDGVLFDKGLKAIICCPDNISGTYSIPQGVNTIAKGAFSYCESLSSIIIPNSVFEIEDSAFQFCSSVNSISIPNSVKNIGAQAFEGCQALQSIVVPESVTSIGDQAFSNCYALTSVKLSSNLTNISSGTFNECRMLTEVEIPNGVTTIGEGAFTGCSTLTDLLIPNSVKIISDWAFQGCSSLASVVIPEGVTSVGEGAFYCCSSISSIAIPSTVVSMGTISSRCPKLVSYNVDKKNTAYASKDGVLFDKSIQTLIDFPEGKSGAYIIPNSVTQISNGAFMFCGLLTSIVVPSHVKQIGDCTFSGCSSLVSITIPYGLITISGEAFSGCSSLESIDIPESVVSIGASAFSGCSSLSSIIIPRNIKTIEPQTFSDCHSLANITLPASLTSIGRAAFFWCFPLKDVYYAGSQEEWQRISVNSINNDWLMEASIHYHSGGSGSCGDNLTWTYDNGNLEIRGTGEMYDFDEAHLPPWSNIAGEIKSIYVWGDTSSVGKNAFQGCVNATSTAIDISVTKIGEGAYGTCEKLHAIFYNGTEADWAKVQIGNNNDPLIAAKILCSGTDPWKPGEGTGGEPGGEVTSFNKTLYHSRWLTREGQIMPRNCGDLKNQETPSGILIDLLKGSAMGNATGLWKALSAVFDSIEDIGTIHELAIEEKDMYAAIILAAMEAGTDYDLISSETEDALKFFKDLFSDYKAVVTADMGWELGNSDGQFLAYMETHPSEVQKYLSDYFKKHSKFGAYSDVFKNFSTVMKGFNSLEDYVKTLTSYAILSQTTESMEEVLRSALNVSRQTYGTLHPLTVAFAETLSIITESKENLIRAVTMKEITVIGEGMAKYLVKEFWERASSYLYTNMPGLAILQAGYKVGKTISNALCNTDDVIEAYLKMKATLDVDRVIASTYELMKAEAQNNNTIENAEKHLSAMTLVFKMLDTDCENAYSYVDKLDSAVLSKVEQFFGKKGYAGVKESIKSIQNSYSVDHIMALKGWVDWLEDDYPNSGLYEYYNEIYWGGGTGGSFGGGSGGGFRGSINPTKQITVACPVNVYVKDAGGNIVAYVEGDEVACYADDLMIGKIGEEKIIHFYGKSDYTVDCVGYDTGTMSLYTEDVEDGSEVNYYDLPVSNEKTYTATVSATAGESCVLKDSASGETVAADFDPSKNGSAYPLKVVSGTFLRQNEIHAESSVTTGEEIDISAFVPEEYEFVRWEATEGNCVIKDPTARHTSLIMPDEKVTITAVMKEPEKENSNITGVSAVSALTYTGAPQKGYTGTPASDYEGEYEIHYSGRNSTVYDSDNAPADAGDYTVTIKIPDRDTRYTGNVSLDFTIAKAAQAAPSAPELSKKTSGSVTLKAIPESERGTAAQYSRDGGVTWQDSPVFDGLSAGTEYRFMARYASTENYETSPASEALSVTTDGDSAGETPSVPPVSGDLGPDSPAPDTPAEWENPYTDVSESAWYYDAVRYVTEQGLMIGHGNGTFGPDEEISRGQFAQILYNKEGKPEAAVESGFTDVPRSQWYYSAVMWAAGSGVVSGYGNGKYGPNDPITREQLAAMLWRYAGKSETDGSLSGFSDAGKASAYARPALTWAVENGIVNGKGNGILDPGGKATRSEAAQMIKQFCKVQEKVKVQR